MPPPTETKHPEYQVHIAFTSEFTSVSSFSLLTLANMMGFVVGYASCDSQ
jgi:hypothetical protein